jgi:uncharacterized protein DUF5320
LRCQGKMGPGRTGVVVDKVVARAGARGPTRWAGLRVPGRVAIVSARVVGRRWPTCGVSRVRLRTAPNAVRKWYGNSFLERSMKMPGGNGTGPMGMGAMTGRAAGFCAGYAAPGFANPVGGRGQGFGGAGRGRGGGGRGRGFGVGAGRFGWAPMAAGYPGYGGFAPAAPTREQELDALKQQAAHFQGALEDITNRIDELQSQASSK